MPPTASNPNAEGSGTGWIEHSRINGFVSLADCRLFTQTLRRMLLCLSRKLRSFMTEILPLGSLEELFCAFQTKTTLVTIFFLTTKLTSSKTFSLAHGLLKPL